MFDKVRASLAALRAKFPGVQDPRMFALQSLTLTIPPAYRDRAATSADVGKLCAAAYQLVRELGAAGACIIAHPVGDKDRSCRTFLPHLNVLWWHARPARMLAATDIERAAHRERVRRAWGDALGMDPAREDPATVVFMHAIPANEEAWLRFCCDYNARVFAGWGRWNRRWVRWYGEHEKPAPQPDRACCPDCHERLRVRAEGWNEVRDELAFLEQRQETGPPLDLDVELPGDSQQLPFAWFHPAYIESISGRPRDAGPVVLEALPGGLA